MHYINFFTFAFSIVHFMNVSHFGDYFVLKTIKFSYILYKLIYNEAKKCPLLL